MTVNKLITKQQLITKYKLKPVERSKVIEILYKGGYQNKIHKNTKLPIEIYQRKSNYGTELYITFNMNIRMAQIEFYCDNDKIMVSVFDFLKEINPKFSLSSINEYKSLDEFYSKYNDILLDKYIELKNKRKSKYKNLKLFDFQLKMGQFNCSYVKQNIKLFCDVFKDLSEISFDDEINFI